MKKPLLIKKLILVFCTLFSLLALEGQETFFEFIPGWRARHLLKADIDGFVVSGAVDSDPSGFHIINNRIDPSGNLLGSNEIQYDTLLSIGGPLRWTTSDPA